MSQMSFGDSEYDVKRKETRRELFLEGMEQAAPWNALIGLIGSFYPEAGRGRHPYPLETMLRGLGHQLFDLAAKALLAGSRPLADGLSVSEGQLSRAGDRSNRMVQSDYDSRDSLRGVLDITTAAQRAGAGLESGSREKPASVD